MPVVRDYLELSLGEAREQWRSIRTRQPRTNKQVDFLPVETLLCLAANLLVNNSRFGGANSDQAPEPVPSLAKLFDRSNGSVLSKMGNLRGQRVNGAAHEKEIAIVLFADRERLGDLYRLILATARTEGVTPTLLPDFLNLENSSGAPTLLGQQELDGQALSDIEARVATLVPGESPLEAFMTQRLAMVAARVNQHLFAKGVLDNHGHRCVFCGLALRLDNDRVGRMLIASHIKPWSKSSDRERLDFRNGLCACPTHDVAFDTGLITVADDLSIHVRSDIAAQAANHPEVAAAFGRPPLAEKLVLPASAQPPRPEYLAYHREKIFAA